MGLGWFPSFLTHVKGFDWVWRGSLRYTGFSCVLMPFDRLFSTKEWRTEVKHRGLNASGSATSNLHIETAPPPAPRHKHTRRQKRFSHQKGAASPSRPTQKTRAGNKEGPLCVSACARKSGLRYYLHFFCRAACDQHRRWPRDIWPTSRWLARMRRWPATPRIDGPV